MSGGAATRGRRSRPRSRRDTRDEESDSAGGLVQLTSERPTGAGSLMHKTVFSRLLVVLAALLAACSLHGSPYPVTWPALVSSGDRRCPDLAARYTDRGETFDSPHWISLAGLLLGVRAT